MISTPTPAPVRGAACLSDEMLARNADRWFPVRRITAPDADARAAHALRYESYCLDRGLLPSDRYPDRSERDDYDHRSIQVLARAADGRPAGCLRLIRSSQAGDLPCEAHTAITDPRFGLIDRSALGEVSRMAIQRDFRRGLLGDGTLALARGGVPVLLLALYRRLYQASRDEGIRWWVAAMERPHAQALGRTGFAATEIGPESDYHGLVVPCLFDLGGLESVLAARRPDLLAWLGRP